jgi:hypothetical protein
MIQTIHIDELRSHLDYAKDKLSLEKQDILKLSPLAEGFNREEYAFAYVRAERMGMRVINRRLTEISWLPMQLDPRSEIMSEDRNSMKRWLTSAIMHAPDSGKFGNDFMHALTRCGIEKGWDHPDFIKLAARVANLFRDLSCLIGLIYYCSWLNENNVDELTLSNPGDLSRTAEEVAALIQSPEIYRYLRAQEQDVEKQSARKAKKSVLPKPAKKEPPVLRVIKNMNYFDPMLPEGAPL